MNNLKAVFLLTLLSGLLLLFGYFVAGADGLIAALVLAIVVNVGSYRFSDRLALAMTGAKEVTSVDEPRLHAIIEEVAAQAQLPKPRVYIVHHDAPNAFATGRDSKHAAVAATSGILGLLDDRELTAVLGHELGHVRNHDTLVNAIIATIAGAVMYIAVMGRWGMFFGGFGGRSRGTGMAQVVAWLSMILFAPLAATLIRLAISREREYGADKVSTEITHMPLALASALEKLDDYSRLWPLQVNPAMSHLFIVNPLGDVSLSKLFSTHPHVEDRIKRLREIAGLVGTPSYHADVTLAKEARS